MQSLLSPLAVIPPEPAGAPPSIPAAPPPEHAPTSNSEHGSVKVRRKDLIPISGSGEKVGRTTRDHPFGLAERGLRPTHRSQQREGNFAHVVTNLTKVLVAFEFPARLEDSRGAIEDNRGAIKDNRVLQVSRTVCLGGSSLGLIGSPNRWLFDP
jgi:hypothetical protein